MRAQLYANLEKAIDGWMDKSCEDNNWPSVIVGDQTAALMAQAARAVFDAVVEAQEHAVREGSLTMP